MMGAARILDDNQSCNRQSTIAEATNKALDV